MLLLLSARKVLASVLGEPGRTNTVLDCVLFKSGHIVIGTDATVPVMPDISKGESYVKGGQGRGGGGKGDKYQRHSDVSGARWVSHTMQRQRG